MREQFEKLVAERKIQKHHVDNLVALVSSGYCYHKSWGCGRIRTLDPVFARFTIDFPNKPGHVMALSFAAETLKPLPKEHILVKKLTELESLKRLATENPVELVKLAIASCAGKATVDQLQQLLTPDIVETNWRKWWDATKPLLKKSGLFHIPVKKTDPILLLERETSPEERLINEFNQAKGLKERIRVVEEIIKAAPEISNLQLIASEIVDSLNKEISAFMASQTALALEAIFARDQLIQLAKLEPNPNQPTATDVWNQGNDIANVFEKIGPQKRKQAIESLKAARPNDWPQLLINIINTVSAKVCHVIAEALIQAGYLDQLKSLISKHILEKSASSELLLWLLKERSALYADILGANVLRAALSAIDRDRFSDKRSSKLQEYLVADQNLIADLLQTAELDEVRDLTRYIQMTPAFSDERDRRVLLGRIIKLYPSIQSLITAETVRQEQPLIVSWESLERKRAEYEELVHKKLPAIARDIAHALSYGDLRENAEYKAAKETQRLLLQQKAELEAMLAKAQATDFSQVTGEVVEPGTVVTIVDVESGISETITILGAWENDPDRNIISYLSPIAQALMGKKVEDLVEVQFSSTPHTYRIVAIKPYYTATPESKLSTVQSTKSHLSTPQQSTTDPSQPSGIPSEAPAESNQSEFS